MKTTNAGFKEKHLLVVAHDRGAWNGLWPVLSKTVDAGSNVTVHLSGTCARHFSEKILPSDPRFKIISGTSETVVEFVQQPSDLLLVGASNSPDGTQIAVNAIQHTKSKTAAAFEDMYGSLVPALKLLGITSLNQLNAIFFSDPIAQDFANNSIELGKNAIITGNPAFDYVLDIRQNWEAKRKQQRKILKAKPEQKIFLVAGGLNGTADIIEIVQGAIESQNLYQSVLLTISLHPRSTSEDREKSAIAINALKQTDTQFRVLPEKSAVESYVPATDFILSPYATANRIAILLQILGTTYIRSPAIQADLNKEKNLDIPIEVTQSAAWYAESDAEFAEIINEVTHPKQSSKVPSIQAAQAKLFEEQFPNGQPATSRLLQELGKLLDG